MKLAHLHAASRLAAKLEQLKDERDSAGALVSFDTLAKRDEKMLALMRAAIRAEYTRRVDDVIGELTKLGIEIN